VTIRPITTESIRSLTSDKRTVGRSALGRRRQLLADLGGLVKRDSLSTFVIELLSLVVPSGAVSPW
jgi:hypothetical protein